MDQLSKESLNQIILLINKNDLREAGIKANQLLNKFPNSDIIHNLIGSIHVKNQKYENALHYFREALLINPKFISAKLNMGVALQNLDKNTEAINCFKETLKVNPDLFAAYNNIGFINNRQGNYSDAILFLKKAIKIKPDYAEAYLNLGISLQKLKQYSDALKNFATATKLNKNLYLAYYYSGEIYRKLNKYSEAYDCYIKSKHEKTDARKLECLLMLNLKEEYTKQIKYLSNELSEDRRLAAISAYMSNQFNIIDIFPFCPSPLNFVYETNLNKSFNNFDNFLKILFSEITNQDFTWEPYARTTVKGYVTKGNLSDLNLPSILNLEKIFREKIAEYKKHYIKQKCNFITKWPTKFKFSIWSNRLKSEGHNIPHHHPSGWLSGVFYLKIPPTTNKNEAGIEFSLHGDEYKIINKNIPKKNIQPKVGDLILFPSSLFHKTISFKSKEERVCIAFDIIKIN